MKWILVITALAVVLGAWAGFRANGSDSLDAKFQAGLATFLACHLLFCLWVWYRAMPGSGDRMVLPGVMVLSASMLVNILPRVFWPGAERLHIAATTTSAAGLVVVLVMHIRRRRALRQGGPTL